MADGTAIEWTDATWTPIRAEQLFFGGRSPTSRIGWHCEHVSEGCRNCYAEGINRRLGTGLSFKPGLLGRLGPSGIEVFLDEKMLTQPLRWKRPRMIFVCSMTDLFADFVKDEWIDRVFAVMALCPQHRFQVLTKRAKRMREYFAHVHRLHMINGAIWSLLGTSIGSKVKHDGNWRVALPLPNVLLGVSAEDQANADARIPDLLATPAAVRFVSLEPLLGAIDLNNVETEHPRIRIDALNGLKWLGEWDDYNKLNWVIVGGESGPHARPMHPDWARSLRDQCQAADVPYFKKQWGEWAPQADHDWYADHHTSLPMVVWDGSRWRDDDGSIEGEWMIRVGKKRAGRLLDGREWNEMPA